MRPIITIPLVAKSPSTLIEVTAEIASAHCASNQVAADMLPALIGQIYEALTVGTNAPTTSPADKLVPAVSLKQSVFPDYIVCLEDGKKLKMLKRHLQAAYGMTPQQYRERWGLPENYPINAPNYTRRRSALSKKNGLGLSRREPAE